MTDKYTPNKAPNGNTYLRDWWNKVVETNFSTIFQVFSKHIVGSGDRHTADTVDFDSETTVEEKINTEIADRENGDKELADDLNAEVQAREENNEQLRDLINTERINRESNDALKANVTDVLTKNNTDSYSPTSNYHPATKKYVDDIAMNSGAGDMLRAVYDMDGSGVVDDSEKLGGVEAEKYALQTQVQEKVNEIHDILEQDGIIATVKADEVIPNNATKLLMIGNATKVRTDYDADTNVAMNQNITNDDGGTLTLYIGDDVPDKCKGQTIWLIGFDGETDDTYAVFKIDTLSQFNTPPELTEVSPDGTILGSDGWTGTGFVSLENNVRVDYKRYQVSKYTNSDGSISNKYSPFTQVHGFQRFCLRFADPSSNKWKNWTPWIDIDGVAYEFFYSPTRKLYEALIPATDKLAEEIVAEIRWERAEPDVIRYGKVSQCCAVGSADNGTTPVYSFFTDEASLRDNSGAYCTLDKNILGEIVNGNISAPIVDNINLLAKLHLQIDVSSSGSLSSATPLISVSQLIVGTITELPIDTIDNFA